MDIKDEKVKCTDANDPPLNGKDSMNEKQLNFFEKPKTELDAIWELVTEMKESNGKVRRKLFAEIKDLRSELIEVKAENQRLKFHTEDKRVFSWTG